MSLNPDMPTVAARRVIYLKEFADKHVPGTGDPVGRLSLHPASRPLAITARCWQCEGDDDPGTASRIDACKISRCALHPHRPFQRGGYKANLAQRIAAVPAAPAGAVLSPPERAALEPTSRTLAVKAYCYDCMGGKPAGVKNPNGNIRKLVAECPVHRCALWDVRGWKNWQDHAEIAEIDEKDDSLDSDPSSNAPVTRKDGALEVSRADNSIEPIPA